MRTGGKNRKSAALHVLQATFRKQRHGQPAVPDHVPEGVPEPPAGLPGAVLAQWQVTVGHLQALGVVSRVDGLIVEQYSRLFVETAHLVVRQADVGASIARLDAQLSTVTGAELVQCVQAITKLRQVEARYATQIRQGRMAQRQYLIELCLTPASRSRGVSRPATTAPTMDPKKQKYLDAITKPSA